MSAEEDIRAALIGAAPVTDIVGTKIYNEAIPQETGWPAIAFQRVSTETLLTIHGTIALETAAMQVVCYSTRRSEAEDLATKITTALQAAKLIQFNRAGGYIANLDLHSVTLQFNHYL